MNEKNSNKNSSRAENENPDSTKEEMNGEHKAPYFNLSSWAPYGHLDQVAPTQPYNPHHYHHHFISLSQSDVVPNYGQNPNPACQFHQQQGADSAYYASLAAAYGVTLQNTANALHKNTNSNSARKRTKIVQWCEVCKIACDTRDVLEIHKTGKKHKENLEKLEGHSTNTNPNTNGDCARKKTKVVQWCEVCKIACDTRDVLELHKLGKKHKENLEKLEGRRPTNTNPFHRNSNGKNACKKKKVVHIQRCEVCNIACDTKAVLDIHKSGKKHKENLEKLRGPANSSPALAILPRLPVTPITPS